jgi:hypothetical protein
MEKTQERVNQTEGRKNLMILAKGLLAEIEPILKGEGQAEFDMSQYCEVEVSQVQEVASIKKTITISVSDQAEIQKQKHTCGSIGCAIGFAPFYGIKKEEGETFYEYGYRVFELDNEEEIEEAKNREMDVNYSEEELDNDTFRHNHRGVFTYLFSSDWRHTDNTKEGAGKRIKHYLEKGLPRNWYEQMSGQANLSYLTENEE